MRGGLGPGDAAACQARGLIRFHGAPAAPARGLTAKVAGAQAYERKAGELQRSVKRGEEGSADSAKERAALLHQLHAAEQVPTSSRRRPATAVLARSPAGQMIVDSPVPSPMGLENRKGAPQDRQHASENR